MKSRFNWIGLGLVAFGSVCLAATPNATNLITDAQANARQVRSAAAGIEALAKEPDAQWKQFDKQWNEIKPAEDRLAADIHTLDAMHSSLTAPQQKSVDEGTKLVQEIEARTHAIHSMLNQPNMLNSAVLDNQSTQFEREGRRLVIEARDLAQDMRTS